MSVLTSSPRLRWLVPASAALAVLGGGAAIGAVTAAADPSLPPRSAAELLVDLQNARLDGLSGTVVARVDLGLPPLPGIGAGSSDLTALTTGTHTLRVWYSGPDHARVALLGTLGETDVVSNGTDVWTWSSRENKATHRTLPARDTAASPLPHALPSASGLGLTPQQLATMALAALDPTTSVTTDGSASVAGRDAYELVLSPKDPVSLVGSIRLAIDAKQHVPLRVRVLARGAADPAIEVAFTQVSFDRPDAGQFVFKPPPGATVEEADAKPAAGEPDAQPHAAAATKVIGKGWTSVLVARPPADMQQDKTFGAFLAQMPAASGTWGSGHLLSGQLFSVLITDDGRLLVGAVGPQRLFQAAADPAAQLGS